MNNWLFTIFSDTTMRSQRLSSSNQTSTVEIIIITRKIPRKEYYYDYDYCYWIKSGKNPDFEHSARLGILWRWPMQKNELIDWSLVSRWRSLDINYTYQTVCTRKTINNSSKWPTRRKSIFFLEYNYIIELNIGFFVSPLSSTLQSMQCNASFYLCVFGLIYLL